MSAHLDTIDCYIYPDLPESKPLLIMEWIGGDRILFASDYPHSDFDDSLVAIPSFLGAERRRMIYSDNARSLFGWK